MNRVIFILRYFVVIAISVLPLALYMKYVMGIVLHYDNPLIMIGFGAVLLIFADIVQLRMKK